MKFKEFKEVGEYGDLSNLTVKLDGEEINIFNYPVDVINDFFVVKSYRVERGFVVDLIDPDAKLIERMAEKGIRYSREERTLSDDEIEDFSNELHRLADDIMDGYYSQVEMNHVFKAMRGAIHNRQIRRKRHTGAKL
jgi:hypothetical protein